MKLSAFAPRRRGSAPSAALFSLVCLASACGGGAPGDRRDGGADADGAVTEGGLTSCAAGQSTCGAACVDLATDTANCGACGRACSVGSNASARCVAGVCRPQCASGFADCDRATANGCETALGTDTTNCGACGSACANGANASAVCESGVCGATCSTGFDDCDGATENGCESVTATDRENCGACGRACPWPARSEYACAASACTFSCRRGYADCDRSGTNGCEVSLVSARNCGACGVACGSATRYCAEGAAGIACVSSCPADTTDCDFACIRTDRDPDNCGACRNVCPGGVNAQAACVSGRCGLECRPGYADCDGDPATGCEVNLALNAQHCGACGNACGGGTSGEGYCAAGVCRLRCRPGALDCDRVLATGCEVDSASDERNCGGCGRVCEDPPNGSALCNVGSCEFACDTGFGNCDGDAANGCETVLRSSPAHCGACGRACAAGQSCIEGACVDEPCGAGHDDCDGDTATRCETDLYTSLEHCGACGTRCSRANAAARCAAGGCTFDACNGGFGNCDGDRANGCETPLTTVTNCGACGSLCVFPAAGSMCVSGACVMGMCSPGFADCDRDPRTGCEADTRENALHCGACGNACVAGQSCMEGRCVGVVLPPMDGGVTSGDGSAGDATMDSGPGLDAAPGADGSESDGSSADGATDGGLAAVRSIAVEPPNGILPAGAMLSLRVVATRTDGSTFELLDGVTWTSSAPGTATVNPMGVVTAVAANATAARITASYTPVGAAMPLTASSSVLVTSATLRALSVTLVEGTSVRVGGMGQLRVLGSYSDGSMQDLTALASYASSSSATATVGAGGVVTGVAIGTVTITATTGGMSATLSLSVDGAVVTALLVAPAAPDQLPVGATQRFSATARFSDGTSRDVTDEPGVSFSSSNTMVATIAGSGATKGTATGVRPGASIITATYAPATGTPVTSSPVPISVIDAQVRTIVVTPAMATTPAGATVRFTATATLSDGSTRDVSLDPTVSWSSSAATIATVSNLDAQKGVATGVSAGTATVTATYNSGLSGSMPVTASTMLVVTVADCATAMIPACDPATYFTVPAGNPAGGAWAPGDVRVTVSPVAGAPAGTFECRTGHVSATGAITGTFATCTFPHTPTVSLAASGDGVYATEIRYRVSAAGGLVTRASSVRYYLHQSLVGASLCDTAVPDSAFFARARERLPPGRDGNVFRFDASLGTSVRRFAQVANPFVRVNFNPPQNAWFGFGDRTRAGRYNQGDTWSRTDGTVQVLSLRRHFALSDDGSYVIMRRRYEARRPDSRQCAESFNQQNPRRGRFDGFRTEYHCDAIVMNVEGAGVCLNVSAGAVQFATSPRSIFSLLANAGLTPPDLPLTNNVHNAMWRVFSSTYSPASSATDRVGGGYGESARSGNRYFSFKCYGDPSCVTALAATDLRNRAYLADEDQRPLFLPDHLLYRFE